MSMVGSLLLVSDSEIRSLSESPDDVIAFIDAAPDAESPDCVEIDKAWQCLHFLLTGTAWEGQPPLNFIVAGGDPIGDVDVGYGPARSYLSGEVRAIADALDLIDIADLSRRFDAAAMDALEIYPDAGSWGDVDPTSSESFGYYSHAFVELKALIARGRTEKRGLLIWLS